jgi:uncharacterized membrane protein YvlD (DUF360 family)
MLSTILLAWVTATLGLWLAAQLLRGVRLRAFADAVWAGALVAVLQWALTGPVFVLLGIGTLGIGFLFWFVTRWVAAAIVILLSDKLSGRFAVDGFWNALVTALIIAAVGSVLRWAV